MNIFELGVASCTITGIIVGTTLGTHYFGIGGAFLGLFAGGLVGFGFAFVAIFFLAVACKLMFGGSLFPPRKPPQGS
jgi:hypothetical protein